MDKVQAQREATTPSFNKKEMNTIPTLVAPNIDKELKKDNFDTNKTSQLAGNKSTERLEQAADPGIRKDGQPQGKKNA